MKVKKSLGQHWLNSPTAIKTIITAAEIIPGETVLEIGPGRGILTEALLQAGARVLAVEKDQELIGPLATKFSPAVAAGQLDLIAEDILNFDPPSHYKLVANIPYYLTGQILRRFLAGRNQPSKMVLLVQKEVAERIVARSAGRRAKESLLSISVKAYGEPQYIKKVPAGAFRPAPKVDSAVIVINNISKKNFAGPASEKKFFDLVRRGFASKRKMLRNNLKMTAADLKRFEVPGEARAEDLSIDIWLKLSSLL